MNDTLQSMLPSLQQTTITATDCIFTVIDLYNLEKQGDKVEHGVYSVDFNTNIEINSKSYKTVYLIDYFNSITTKTTVDELILR